MSEFFEEVLNACETILGAARRQMERAGLSGFLWPWAEEGGMIN